MSAALERDAETGLILNAAQREALAEAREREGGLSPAELAEARNDNAADDEHDARHDVFLGDDSDDYR